MAFEYNGLNIPLPTMEQSNPWMGVMDHLQDMRRRNLVNKYQQMQNQQEPQNFQANLQHMSDMHNMMNQNQRLAAAKELFMEHNAQSGHLSKEQQLLNAFHNSIPGTLDHAFYARMLNSMGNGKQAMSVTTPSGTRVEFGGSSAGQNPLFPTGLPQSHLDSSNPMSDVTRASTMQKIGRGAAGTVYSTTGPDGKITSQTSAVTSPVLTQNQKAAQALQSLFGSLDELPAAAQYNFPAGSLLRGGQELLNKSGQSQSDLRKYNNAQSALSGIKDTLASAFQVPKTNEGINIISQFVSPHKGETQNQYKWRLNYQVKPELQHRYNIIQNAVKQGISLNPILNNTSGNNLYVPTEFKDKKEYDFYLSGLSPTERVMAKRIMMQRLHGAEK
jgi:hypothetical protein